VRRKEKTQQIKRAEDKLELGGIHKRLEEHGVRLQDQKEELASMNNQIKEIIKSKS